MKVSLNYNNLVSFGLVVLWFTFGAGSSSAQSSTFTYQGRLSDGGTAANGNYDLQFALFDSLSGGAQVGSTQTLNTVAVSNGVFTVSLDFGASAFNGASRFLAISARPSGGGSFTLLAPRQPITSTPYAVRSLNAASADSVPASGVSAGSGNYIQNSSTQQASSDFNISGNGTAGGTLIGNVINATTQYNLNGNRILSNPGVNNLFAGAGAGAAGPTAGANAFFGAKAGASTTGQQNSFFGAEAGFSNTTGSFNSFYGRDTGALNTTGDQNSFFGERAGLGIVASSRNTFIGDGAGGFANTTDGGGNTLLGASTNVSQGATNATAIGVNARVDQSNSLVLGGIAGINGALANTNVGIGTTTPTARLSVVATGSGARVLQLGTERPWVFKQLGTGAATALELTGDDPANNNKNFVINTDGRVGIGTTVPQAKLHVAGPSNQDALFVSGTAKFDGAKAEFFPSTQVAVHGLTGGGSTAVCRDSSNFLSFCSSSLRYKKDVSRFGSGLEIISHLRPIAFTWKQDGIRDIGLAAEEVEKVEPLLTFRNNKGEIEGVKYDQLSAVLINAIKEQQAQIERQQQQIGEQRQQITGLKRLVCRSHRHAAVCK